MSVRRACAYCAISHGHPAPPDPQEPQRVASAIQTLGLSYVVITSVDRDDLTDGGASMFAETIRQTRARTRDCRIEVLIPDFRGTERDLQTVLDARARRAEPQHRNRAAALPNGALGWAILADARAARSLPTIRSGNSHQDRFNGGTGRGPGRTGGDVPRSS